MFDIILLTKQFKTWLELLKTAWETKNPELATELCSDEFIWHETPFKIPITTKRALLDEWKSVEAHKDIAMTYEILNYSNNTGIANWSAAFKRLPEDIDTHLEGIYLVKLDPQGKCTEFHQWYNSKY